MGSILLIPHGTENPEVADIFLGTSWGMGKISTDFDVKGQKIAFGEQEAIIGDRGRKGRKVELNGVIKDTQYWTDSNAFLRQLSAGNYYLLSANQNASDMQLIQHYTASDSRSYYDVATDGIYLYTTYNSLAGNGYLEVTRISTGAVKTTLQLTGVTVRGCAYRDGSFFVLINPNKVRRYFIHSSFQDYKEFTLSGITFMYFCDVDDKHLFVTCYDGSNHYIKKIRLSDSAEIASNTYPSATLRGITIINNHLIAVGKTNGRILLNRYVTLGEISDNNISGFSSVSGLRSNGQYIFAVNGGTKVARITRDFQNVTIITPGSPDNFSEANGVAVGFEEIYITDSDTTKQRIQRRYARQYAADNKAYIFLDACDGIEEKFIKANQFNFSKETVTFFSKSGYWQKFPDVDYDATFTGATLFSINVPETIAFPKIIIELPDTVPIANTGTAQAGGTNTITLASGASSVDDFYNGMQVEITSGTGSGQKKIINDYVGSTKVATVDSNWTTSPNATSVYRVRNGQFTLLQLGSNPSMTYDDLNSSTPLDVGDKLVIDCEKGTVSKNYSDDIIHFQGNFFKLNTGMNYFRFSSTCNTYKYNMKIVYSPLI